MMLYNIENPCTATVLSITSSQIVMLFDVIKSVDHVVFEPFFEIFANVSIITNLSQITIFGSDRLYFRKMMLMMLDDVMTDHVILGHKKKDAGAFRPGVSHINYSISDSVSMVVSSTIVVTPFAESARPSAIR